MRAERSAQPSIRLVVPGTLATLTGGYLYDRRMLAELGRLGWATEVVALDPSFPNPTQDALDAAAACFAAIPDASLVVVDGLALAGLVDLLPALAARLDVVALVHHPLADETGIDSALAAKLATAEARALAAVRGVVVTSPWTRRRLGDFGVHAARIAVVEPGTEPAEPVPRPPSARVRLLSVATVTPRKGHATLVDALGSLTDLDWRLRCVGSLTRDTDCAAALAAQIGRAGLGDRIDLVGELAPEAIGVEYAAADLFVLPSWLEGYGMAIVEAIAHGVPVVSTTAGAIPDTAPEDAARLVPPGDAAALAKVLRELIGNRATLEALAERARAAAARLPSWEAAGRRFSAAITGVGRP